MIPVPSGVRVWLAVGRTDMRRGMNGLALQVQEALRRDPHAGDLYVFRGASVGMLHHACNRSIAVYGRPSEEQHDLVGTGVRVWGRPRIRGGWGPSITKTERRRSANLLQMPRGLMYKLR
jgi:transposase